MADENNQNNQNEQSGSYYEPQQAENTNQYNQPQQQYYQVPQDDNQFNYNVNMAPQEEKANIGLAILSFIIPIVGLVLYLTQKKDKPKTSKACGKAALASVIIYIIVCIITFAASAFMAKKALEDPAASEFLNDYSDYMSDYINDYSDALIDDSDAITSDTIGGERQGYIAKPDGKWSAVESSIYGDDTMVAFTNNNEQITMSYYDAAGYTKDDIISSVTSSIANASDTVVTEDVSDQKNQQFSYDDFYGESAYIEYADDYQLFMMFFQSDETSDMIYFAIESVDMTKDEFKQLVNQTVNSHTFVNHQLAVDF